MSCCDEEDDVSDCAEYHMSSIERFILLNQSNKVDVYTVNRLGPISPHRPWNPSDLHCGKCVSVVRFRVNRPISIFSYGFFGPLDPNAFGKYHIEIELMTEWYCTIAKTEVVTPIQKGGIFHVKFDNPCPILPCTWYHSKFSLMGPPTGQSQKICSQKVVKCGDYENVTFRFEEPDSNQLPEINFIMRY